MVDVVTLCPECGSPETYYRRLRDEWLCDACDHRWQVDAPAEPHGPKPRLFLSYGRKDASELSNRLRMDLEALGYEVWQDTHQIVSGRSWERQITDGLRSTQIMIAVLSPHAVRVASDPASPGALDSACLDEISYARFGRPPKPIVPVMALPCEPPFCIFRLDYVDLCSWSDSEDQYRAGFERLVRAIEAAARGEVRYRSWVDRLKPWDFAPFLNEKRSHFCGREWLFEAIEAWRMSTDERALLITGAPGAGKSAVVAELVHRNPLGQVLAYHCCQADTPATLEPGRFVRSIAAMVASKLDAFASKLSEPAVEEALSEEFCSRDPSSAFEAGVLTPLESLEAPEAGVRYILVDALDEALLASAGGPTIVDLLASRLERLPAWLRIVATTRKEPAVLEQLSGLREREIDAQDPRNLDDIRRYVAARVRTPDLASRVAERGMTSDEVAGALCDRSEGNFLYVQQVLVGVERGQIDFGGPDDLPPGLYGLYDRFFGRHFPSEDDYGAVRGLLETVVASLEPLPEQQLARASGLDAEDELPAVLRKLSSYLPERDGRYGVYHKSFADWLTEPRLRGSRFFASRRRGHERLAASCTDEYRRGVDTLSEYAVRHMPSHLAEAGRWEYLARVLCDLTYVEARCASGMAYELLADYANALRRWPRDERGGNPDSEGLAPLDRVRVWSHFVANTTAALTAGEAPAIQLAYNSADGGPVATAAERLLASAQVRGRPWLRMLRRSQFVLDPPCVRTLEGHRDWVYAVSVSQDGRRAVSASRDRTLRLWDLETGVCSRTFGERLEPQFAVAVSRDGLRAVTGGSGGVVRVWDLERGAVLFELSGHQSRVHRIALTAEGRLALSAGGDRTLRLWDLETRSCSRVISGHAKPVLAVAMSEDGTRAISGSSDRTSIVWDLEHGTAERELAGHRDHVLGVALSSDGRTAVTTGKDGVALVWAIPAGDLLHRLEGHSGPVHSVVVTADGKSVITGGDDGTVRVWELDSGRCHAVLEGHRHAVYDLSATGDAGQVVSASADRSLRLWDLWKAGGAKLEPGHVGIVNDLCLSDDGRVAVSGAGDATVCVWDARSGAVRHQLRGHTEAVLSVALVPDGERAVSAGKDGGLRVWDTETGACLRVLAGHDDYVYAVAVTPAVGRVISAGGDMTIRVWSLDDGALHGELTGHADLVSSVAVTPEGRRLISGSWDSRVLVWDIETGRALFELSGHTDAVYRVAVDPGGRWAVSGSNDATLRVWDLETGACRSVLEGHKDWVRAVATAADDHVVSGSWDGTARLWRADGAEQRVFTENHAIHAVAVTADSGLVATGAWTGSLRVWHARTAAGLFAHPPAAGGISRLALRPPLLAVATSSGRVDFFHMENATGAGRALAFPVRLWRFGDRSELGRWDTAASAVCPGCGNRQPVDESAYGRDVTCASAGCGATFRLWGSACDARGLFNGR